VVDHGLTKGIILVPCAKLGTTADATATMILDNVFKRFGLPDKILSDRGPQFASGMFRDLMKKLGIQTSLSTAFHPQTDGTTERFNQEIEAYLSIYCASHPEDWVDALPILEFTHNNRRHSDRKHTPFELMTGTNPLAIPLTHEYTKYPSVEERLSSLTSNREEALAAHEFARSRMLQRIKSNFKPFLVGQKVWLEARNLKTVYNKKIAPKREGPFEIAKVLSPLTYSLRLPSTWRIHNAFHVCLLTPYVENDVHGPNYMRPPAELVNGEDEEWEVERIIGHRKRGRGYQYHVLWKGYPITEATWEPESVFNHAQETLQPYKEYHGLNSKL